MVGFVTGDDGSLVFPEEEAVAYQGGADLGSSKLPRLQPVPQVVSPILPRIELPLRYVTEGHVLRLPEVHPLQLPEGGVEEGISFSPISKVVFGEYHLVEDEGLLLGAEMPHRHISLEVEDGLQRILPVNALRDRISF